MYFYYVRGADVAGGRVQQRQAKTRRVQLADLPQRAADQPQTDQRLQSCEEDVSERLIRFLSPGHEYCTVQHHL